LRLDFFVLKNAEASFSFFKTKNPDEIFIRIVIDVGNEGLQIPY
jgi:hypothetical protein